MPSRRFAVPAAVVLLAVVALAGCDEEPAERTGPSATTSSTPSASSASPGTSGSTSASTSASPSGRFPTYVALGDSYTAAPLVPTTELSDGCLRSDHDYPTVVASALGSQLDDVSCSGATTTSLVGVQQTQRASQPAQFDALKEDTSLVTLGIGGNDGNLFATLVTTCAQAASSDPTGHPCQDQLQGSATDPVAQLKQTRGLVTAAVRGIHDRSPDATIVLVGYPQLVPTTGTCSALPLAAGDYQYVGGLLADLDRALQTAAKRGGATYVDMLTASTGHDICAGDQAWINGSQTDPQRALAFHPFLVEQQAVADLVLEAVTKLG